jgi:hypothetical protein
MIRKSTLSDEACPVKQKHTPVEEALACQHSACNELIASLDSLRKRLNPILEPTPCSDGGDDACEKECPDILLTHRIDENTNGVRTARSIVSDINERLML